MSQNENNTLFYGYSAITAGIASAASYLTGPMLAATTLMQNLFSFSPLALQLASYSAAPLFVATFAYAAYNFFSSSNQDLNEDLDSASLADEESELPEQNKDEVKAEESNELDTESYESDEEKLDEEYSYHPRDLAKGAFERIKKSLSGSLSPR